jgi:hypothetical protein
MLVANFGKKSSNSAFNYPGKQSQYDIDLNQAYQDAGHSLTPFVGKNVAENIAAQRQMNFQERMSNTALQRYTADANAAGLNPILGLSAGGASSPGGASPNIDNP